MLLENEYHNWVCIPEFTYIMNCTMKEYNMRLKEK